MCVIATGYKKDFELAWFEACCDHNPDGFYVSRVNRNQSIRTLKVEEATEFFKASHPNDLIVLHARIKSVGPVNANNIHGWSSAGVSFCHNGTLSIKARKDLTDSETFFRDIFLPIYKSCNKRLTPAVEAAINACIGTSKFLVTRKKKVYRYGNYQQKGKCYFSNLFWDTSYSKPSSKVKDYGSASVGYWTSWKPSSSAKSKSIYGGYDYDDYDYGWENYTAKSNADKTIPNVLPLYVTQVTDETLRAINRYVTAGKLPDVTALLVGTDLFGGYDRTHLPLTNVTSKIQYFNYRHHIYNAYFVADWPGKEESIHALAKLLDGKLMANDRELYTFISSEIHKKMPDAERSFRYAKHNEELKKSIEDRNVNTIPSLWDEYCKEYAEQTFNTMLRMFSNNLTYAGIVAALRSRYACGWIDDSAACILYTAYTTIWEYGQIIVNKLVEDVPTLTQKYIDKLFDGKYTIHDDRLFAFGDFWGVLAASALEEPQRDDTVSTRMGTVMAIAADVVDTFELDAKLESSMPSRFINLTEDMPEDISDTFI